MGNLYTATETLQRAYQAIIDEHDISTLTFQIGDETVTQNTGIPDRMEFYRQQFNGKDLTIAERMLSYTRKSGGVFATKQIIRDIATEQEVKDQAAAEYILDSIIANLSPLDPSKIELSDEEKQKTLDELQFSASTKDGDSPDVDSSSTDDNSHNQKPLEPKKSNIS